MPVAIKYVVAVVLLFCAIGIASADDGNETDTTPIIPAVSFGGIIDAVTIEVSGWFKQLVILGIIIGGAVYAYSRSDDSKASGLSFLKNNVLAVIFVIGLLWVVNWLFTLS